jgi:hypothetical protein
LRGRLVGNEYRSKCNGKGYSSISSNDELLPKKIKRANGKGKSKAGEKEVCDERIMVVKRQAKTKNRR